MNIFRDHGDATPVDVGLFVGTSEDDAPPAPVPEADPRDLAELAAELRDARRMLSLASLG